jgi:hypothetical protein
MCDNFSSFFLINFAGRLDWRGGRGLRAVRRVVRGHGDLVVVASL